MSKWRLSEPEGGWWGYIVVVSAFFIQVLAFGTAQTIGVYNIYFLDIFPDSAAAISLVGAINFGVFLGAGPIVSGLMSRWSHRTVCLSGAILSSIGMTCMPFAPTIQYMYFFYGIVTGVGFSLLYVPSHILCGLYFDKHRSLATGVATAGSGLGTTIFPIMIYFFIEKYNWRGSLFILAGLNLHTIVFAALLRPVPKRRRMKKKKTNVEDEVNDADDLRCGNALLESVPYDADVLELKELNSETLSETGNNDCNTAEIQKCETDHEQSSSLLPEVSDKPAGIIQNGSFPPPRVIDKRRKSVAQKVQHHFCTIFNFTFVIYFLNNILWNLGVMIALVFAPEYFTVVGLTTSQASTVLTIIGAGNTVGCVVSGALGNIKCCDRIILYIISNLASGVISLCIPLPFLHTYLLLSLVGFLWGFMFGLILGLLVVVTADILGTERLGMGFGYLMFGNGIGLFVGPPLAGLILDATKSLAPAFYLSGAVIIFSALLVCIIPIQWKLFPGTRPQHSVVSEEAVGSPPLKLAEA